MMANDGQIAEDTLFEPERQRARAIDWDQSDRGLSSGRAAIVLQSRRRIHGRIRIYANFNRDTLASREPSIHGTTAMDGGLAPKVCPMTILTDIVMEDPRWNAMGLDALAENAAINTLEFLNFPTEGYEIAVLACDDARIADLNTEFREKPTATNVLSWPAYELAPEQDGGTPNPPPAPDPSMGESLGDIAIAFETCQREAEDAGKPIADHVTHLIVHGVLHLLGYDHVRDRDATLMEGIETQILGKMGIADPYRG